MTIPQLRQEAKDLRDLANRFLLYGEKHSLDDASRRLAELFRQVPLVLGNRARGLTLEGVPKSWDEVSEHADHIIQVCNDAEPHAIGEIPIYGYVATLILLDPQALRSF
jgi:hypothetical protein